ncbi:MAG: carbon monoxide dehydrogenase subunit G [Chloroflexota bacterium]|nr:carbon monoxide dehydrogenase subunit G [Chloroflexota bacterium]
MDISATYVFDAPAQKVWDTLMDPQALAACVPGCQSLEPTGDNEYQAVVNISLGPVRGNFTAKVAITETNPYQSYRLSLSGNSNIGFGSGDSLVTLEEDGGKTTVRVDTHAQAGGTVARVGQRMMESVARGMLDRFFTCLQETVGKG